MSAPRHDDPCPAVQPKQYSPVMILLFEWMSISKSSAFAGTPTPIGACKARLKSQSCRSPSQATSIWLAMSITDCIVCQFIDSLLPGPASRWQCAHELLQRSPTFACTIDMSNAFRIEPVTSHTFASKLSVVSSKQFAGFNNSRLLLAGEVIAFDKSVWYLFQK